jgi:uncharacterized repeat protein (TIGR01451 family)
MLAECVIARVKRRGPLAVAAFASALSAFIAPSLSASTLSGTFTITGSPSATSRSGTYTTPEGDTGTFLLQQIAAAGYVSPPTFTGGANGIMVLNNQTITGGDSFTYRLTLTPNAGQAQSLIAEIGQASYGTSFNTEPARMTYTYSSMVGPVSGVLSNNPNVTMHPTNGSSISGSQPQIRTYTGTPDPIIKNATPATNYPALAAGTSIPSGTTVQNYGVATNDTQYRVDFTNTTVLDIAYAGNLSDAGFGTIGETFNETISFGVRRNPVVVQFLKRSIGGSGTFSFSAQTNLSAIPAPINTALANPGPVLPTQLTATSINTDATLTETPLAGFVLTGFSCTDAGSAITGSTGTFGTFAGNVVTIPAANIRAGSNITCTIVNSVTAPSMVVTKTPSVPSVSAAGTVITYSIDVNNNGNVPLSGITMSDPLAPVTCTTSGNATIAVLAVGATENCSAQFTVTQSVLDTGGSAILNTATASTTYGGTPVSAGGNASVTKIRNPQLTITKSADTAGPVSVGTIITYTFLVRNSGNVTISGVGVNDTHNGTGLVPVPGSEIVTTDVVPLGDSTDASQNGSWDTLRPGDTIRFTATYQVTQGDIDTLQ